MKVISNLFRCVLVPMVLAAFCVPAESVSAQGLIPFNGSAPGQQTYAADEAPPGEGSLYQKLTGQAEGTFPVMGNTTVEYTLWVFGGFLIGHSFLEATLTAADGSQLHIFGLRFVDGYFLSLPPNFPDGPVSQGNWSIVGGTGRFAGTTGGGTYGVVQTGYLIGIGDSKPAVLSLFGVISHPSNP